MTYAAALCRMWKVTITKTLHKYAKEGAILPATFDWEEDNGAATGSPAAGTTRTTGRTDVNWKNIDDSTSLYSSYPITAGANSFTKYIFGKFTGTFTSISAGFFAHTAGSFSTGVSLYGLVTSTYATPSTATNASLTVNMTTVISISSGQTVLFGTSGPQDASPSSSNSSNPCYTQYLATQLQTTSLAAGGSIGTITLTLQYNES